EERVVLVEAEEGAERHHEAALRLGAPPRARDVLELAPQLRSDPARRQRLGPEARALEPVDGLAHLADRAALEREAVDLDHRLVAVVERLQPVGAIEVE